MFDKADDISDNFFEVPVSAEQIRPWKPVLEIADEFFRIVAEKDGTDALLAPCDQDGAKRTLADGKLDIGIEAAVPEGGRGHAKHLIGFRIEPAIGIKAGVVDRFGHAALAVNKLFPHPLRPPGRSIDLRRNTRDLLEQAMKVERTHVGRPGNFCERRQFLRVFDGSACGGYRGRMLSRERQIVRTTAFTCPKSAFLRLLAGREKDDV